MAAHVRQGALVIVRRVRRGCEWLLGQLRNPDGGRGRPPQVTWAWARSSLGVGLCVTRRPPGPATPAPSPEPAEFAGRG